MNQDGTKARIKLLVALLIAVIGLTLCQPVPARIVTPGSSAQNTATGIFEASAMCTLTGGKAVVTVPVGRSVRITWGWSAYTEQQIKDYLDAQITQVTLDGVVVTNVNQGVIQSLNQKFAVFWTADVGVLSPGTHLVAYVGKWKHKIDDGSETFGPESETETLSDKCELLVK